MADETVINDNDRGNNGKTVINCSSKSSSNNDKTVINTGSSSGTVINSGSAFSAKLRTAVNTGNTGNSSAVAMRFSENDVIAGRYLVNRKINRNSGEADIFEVQDLQENNTVKALKLFRRKDAIKSDVLSRLMNIDSPYVAAFSDKGEINGFTYLVMPYYGKGSLASYIERGITFSPDEIRTLILPSVLGGLKAVHDAGIIHKDLKPANMMIADDESHIVLIDFGISSVADGGTMVVTQTGRSPFYSAPETATGLFWTGSDYYSLGISLYELNTGSTPYGNAEIEDVTRYALAQKIPYAEGFDPALKDLIDALTYRDISFRNDESNPNRRWGHDEISRWLRGEKLPVPGRIPNAQSLMNSGADGSSVMPYIFKEKKYFAVEEITKALLDSWDAGKKEVFRGFTAKYFELTNNAEAMNLCLAAERELEGYPDDADGIFFRLMYGLFPRKEIIWKDQRFSDMHELAERLKTAVTTEDPDFLDSMVSFLTPRNMEVYTADDSLDSETKEKLMTAASRMEAMRNISPGPVPPEESAFIREVREERSFATEAMEKFSSIPEDEFIRREPYAFNGIKYDDITTALLSSWNEGKRIAFSGSLAKHYGFHENPKAVELCHNAEREYGENPEDGDGIFFRLMYSLVPRNEIFWQGFRFGDIEELENRLKISEEFGEKSVTETLRQFLCGRNLDAYTGNVGLSPELLEQTDELGNLILSPALKNDISTLLCCREKRLSSPSLTMSMFSDKPAKTDLRERSIAGGSPEHLVNMAYILPNILFNEQNFNMSGRHFNSVAEFKTCVSEYRRSRFVDFINYTLIAGNRLRSLNRMFSADETEQLKQDLPLILSAQEISWNGIISFDGYVFKNTAEAEKYYTYLEELLKNLRNDADKWNDLENSRFSVTGGYVSDKSALKNKEDGRELILKRKFHEFRSGYMNFMREHAASGIKSHWIETRLPAYSVISGEISEGGTVFFGRTPKKRGEPEKQIEWTVLEIDDKHDRVLLLARQAFSVTSREIDIIGMLRNYAGYIISIALMTAAVISLIYMVKYGFTGFKSVMTAAVLIILSLYMMRNAINHSRSAGTAGRPSHKRWLNRTFKNRFFSEEEKGFIHVTPTLSNIRGLSPSYDKIFILNSNEYHKYGKHIPKEPCMLTDEDGNRLSASCLWWLSDHLYTDNKMAEAVNETGSIVLHPTDDLNCGIRPVIWLEISHTGNSEP